MKVFERDRFQCRYCGRSAPAVVLQLDHVHPHSKGGGDTEDNLVTACVDCNQGKRDHLIDAPELAVERCPSLIGCGLHVHEPHNRFNRQCEIIGDDPEADIVRVQFFGWTFGQPTTIGEYCRSEVVSGGMRFSLYRNLTAMRAAYAQYSGDSDVAL